MTSDSSIELSDIIDKLSTDGVDALSLSAVITVLGEVVDLIAEQYLRREHGKKLEETSVGAWNVVRQIDRFYGRADSLNMALYEKKRS